LCLLIYTGLGRVIAQTCNTQTPLGPTGFTATGGSSLLSIGNGATNPNNVISASTTDFTTLEMGTGTSTIAVKNTTAGFTGYLPGNFVGFDVENIDFTVQNPFGGLKVTTYLNGSKQEESGVFNILLLANSGQSLVSYGPPDALGRQKIGFVASKAFDEMVLSYTKADIPFSNNEHDTKVYSAFVDLRCTGANLACNDMADFTFPSYPVSEYSGQLGGCLASLVGQGALVSADTSDYVTFVEGVQIGCSSWVGVKNNRAGDVYPAGTFAGFETAQYGFVSVSVADLGTITTYLDGVEQESGTSANLIATSFITGKKRIIGFKTTKDFDEIKFTRIGIAGASAGTTRVYRAVVEKVCPGPALVCNTPTQLSKPTFPLTTSSYLTPYLLLVGCTATLTGEEALTTPDPNDFVLMTTFQAAGCYKNVAVKDNATLYTAGTYVAFEIENVSVVSASIGDFQAIVTFKNGVEQERHYKGSLTTATVLTGGRQSFGFLTTKDFDEVRYEEFTGFTPLTASGTKIYNVTLQKMCDGPALACTNDPTPKPIVAKLNLPGAMNGNSGYPVTVASNANDSFLGISVCTNQLLNPERVISADTTDFATIASSGVNCWVSLSVTDHKATYPAGSFAGFDIMNETAVTLDLLGGTYVTTYLDGAVQEFKNAGGLLDILFGGTGIATSSKRRIGFITTKPFDEIKFSQGQIAGISLGTTKVFGAVVTKTAADCAANTLTLATPPATSLTGVINAAKSGNAATDLAPTGGTGPYTYSNGSADPACVAPSGATAISGVTVNANGTYNYTMPATPGNYYFCVKVCDSSTPTPICAVKVYPVTVTATAGLILANPPASALTATPSSARTGNAATELTPSGGTAPYTYSNGSTDPACVAPSGTTALTGVTVNANGTYNYTAPATPGNYYFCVKVCDSTSPTPICSVKVYTVSVTGASCAVGAAVPALKN
jgi:hypothetical protein